MPALVQLAHACEREPYCYLRPLAAIVGEAAVLSALRETLDRRPAVSYREPVMDEAAFLATDRLMRERAAGELGSAV